MSSNPTGPIDLAFTRKPGTGTVTEPTYSGEGPLPKL